MIQSKAGLREMQGNFQGVSLSLLGNPPANPNVACRRGPPLERQRLKAGGILRVASNSAKMVVCYLRSGESAHRNGAEP
jgi:hypothetical protein